MNFLKTRNILFKQTYIRVSLGNITIKKKYFRSISYLQQESFKHNHTIIKVYIYI